LEKEFKERCFYKEYYAYFKLCLKGYNLGSWREKLKIFCVAANCIGFNKMCAVN